MKAQEKHGAECIRVGLRKAQERHGAECIRVCLRTEDGTRKAWCGVY